MKKSVKTESVLQAFARAVGASAGIAVHTGSDVAEEIVKAARSIRRKIAQGADRVKSASTGAKQTSRTKSRAKAAASKPRRAAKPRAARARK